MRGRRLTGVVALASSLLVGILTVVPSRAASGDISTIAGGPGPVSGPATSIAQSPTSVVRVATALFVADRAGGVVRSLEVAPPYTETIVAGGGPDGRGDGGLATAAQLRDPEALAVAPNGDWFIADAADNLVRKVDSSGVISTIAGTGAAGYGGDCSPTITSCPATAAPLNHPAGLAVDAAGNVYVADTDNFRIRKITSAGSISTIAGDGTSTVASTGAGTGDGGPAVVSRVSHVHGLAIAPDGGLYLADTDVGRVRRIDPSGIITTVAGSGAPATGVGDGGRPITAYIDQPFGLSVQTSSGELLVAERARVRRIDPGANTLVDAGLEETITTVVGKGTVGFSGDGAAATAAQVRTPEAAVRSPSGDIVVADTANNRIRAVGGAGVISTVGGNGSTASGDGGPAVEAELSQPFGVAMDEANDVVVSDTGNDRIRRISPTGAISTFAGGGSPAPTSNHGDNGPATSASLAGPTGVTFDGVGNAYIVENRGARVRKVDASGIITTVAGLDGDPGADGNPGFNGDAIRAVYAQLNQPSAVLAEPDGSLLIADTRNRRVRRVDTFGTISTVAGGGSADPGDGQPATSAALSAPTGLAFDAAGRLLIADRGGRIRRVDSAGTIDTVAGGGSAGLGDDGPATAASLLSPASVDVAPDGSIFIADSGHHRIRKVDPNGLITTVAGIGSPGLSGDGRAATGAQLSGPTGIAVTPEGRVVVADRGNNRLRAVDGIAAPRTASAVMVRGLSLASGSATGGQSITLTGVGLAGATSVMFGDTAVGAPFLRDVRDTSLVVTTPEHAPGPSDVRVVTPIGTSPAVAAARFTFFANSWVPAGTLGVDDSHADGQARTGHSATVLDAPACHQAATAPSYCGRVLVAGGKDNSESLLKSAELFDPGSGTWAPVPPMTSPSWNHTATLLGDGRVLIAGRQGSQIYDPGARTWTPTTGTMGTPRELAGAVLLPSGRVLIAGGSSATAAAELFDPATGEWSSAGSASHAREKATATLLPNGSVLVIGQDAADFRSVDIYDPTGTPLLPGSTGTWSAGPPMLMSGADATATLLDGPACHAASAPPWCGRVLVAGGLSNGGPQREAEIYDPGTGTWTLTGSMAHARQHHTASLLPDGRVLVAGGSTGPSELYDPATGTWAQAAELGEARWYQAAVVLGTGDVLVSGGIEAGQTKPVLRSAERFVEHPAERGGPAVTTVDPPAGPTAGGTLVTVHGAGFFSAGTVVRFGSDTLAPTYVADDEVTFLTPGSVQRTVPVAIVTPRGASEPGGGAVFSYGAGSWAPAGQFAFGRYLHSAVLLDGPACRRDDPAAYCGRVLSIGGTAKYSLESGSSFATVTSFDPRTGAWTDLAPMRHARFDFTATLLDGAECHSVSPPSYCGNILVAGGRDPRNDGSGDTTMKSVELYDPAADQWHDAAPLAHARMSHTATLLTGPACAADPPSPWCGRVLIAGGSDLEQGRYPLDASGAGEVYAPSTNEWTTVPLAVARGNHTATTLPDGRVLLAGGLAQGPGRIGVPTGSAEVYDPADGPAGRSTETGRMGVARFSQTATLLSAAPCGANCGKVLVAGGVTATVKGGMPVFTDAAEVFDPASGSWSATGSMAVVRAGHTATLLGDGTVLVAGRHMTFDNGSPAPVTSAEIFHPATGLFTPTSSMSVARGVHSATLLAGPACQGSAIAPCGAVLVAGGAGLDGTTTDTVPILDAEIYVASPAVTGVSPPNGVGGTAVVISGVGFAPGADVRFDAIPAADVQVDSPTRIRAVAPGHPRGRVEVTISTRSGTSAHDPPDLTVSFTYLSTRPPGPVIDPRAEATSPHDITLTFGAPHTDGGEGPPASTYLVRQSPTPIADEATFDAATPLAIGELGASDVGDVLTVAVGGLDPATSYHYAVRAVNDAGMVGPLTPDVSATTPALPAPEPSAPTPACGAVTAGPSRAAYPAGYSLIGVPGNADLASASALYSWFDQGAGGRYTAGSLGAGATGHGYWAYFRCPTVVDLPPGSPSASFPLGAYHASIVGNPSAGPATAAGHDFAATWDPAMNGGAGGYHMSEYRQSLPLAPGQGAWVFAYADSTVTVRSP